MTNRKRYIAPIPYLEGLNEYTEQARRARVEEIVEGNPALKILHKEIIASMNEASRLRRELRQKEKRVGLLAESMKVLLAEHGEGSFSYER